MSRAVSLTTKEDKKTWLIRRKVLWYDLNLLAEEAREDRIFSKTTNLSDIKKKFIKMILEIETSK